jgi:hypothetical protein
MTIAPQLCANVASGEQRFLCGNTWSAHDVGELLRRVAKEFQITHSNYPERSL